jgi:DNA-directed RNA polymerase specialized sigma24 family protein
MTPDGAGPEIQQKRGVQMSAPSQTAIGPPGTGEHTDAELMRAMAALPELSRLLVILADVRGLPYRDIAEACAIPVPVVAAQLHLARGHMIRRLAAPLAEPEGGSRHGSA